jgi:phage tail sheath protein FI
MDSTQPNYVNAKINDELAGSKYILIAQTTGNTNPSPGGSLPLNSGSDGAFAKRDAEVQAYAHAIDLFKLVDVQLLACPEAHEAGVVNAALTHCQNEGDRMFVGHTAVDSDAVASKIYGKTLQGNKVYGAIYFPWIRVADPQGRPKWVPPTGHILGVYARTERERGIWKAPAGNAAQVNGALDVKYHITDEDHTDLVKNGSVNAVRYIPGQGIVIDSSRTLSTNTLWLYVNVRLLFNFVKSSLKSGLRWVVQEPNSEALWNKVKYNSVTPFLMGLWRRGAFGPGAPEEVFTVKVDAENNPPANIQQGILNVEIYFYPSRPAETIIITVGQQEGGATASET